MALFTVSGTGNLVEAPELRHTPNGVPVVSVRIATNKNKKNDAGQWEPIASTFLTATAWRKQAEDIANTFNKGDRITVSGDLKQREYEKDGVKRTAYEIDVRDVAVPMSRGGDTQGGAPSVEASTSGFGGIPAVDEDLPF